MFSRSSSSSTLPEQVKRQILAYIPSDSKILATASARVYHAPFNAKPDSWSYTGLSGVLVLGRDRVTVHADKKLGSGPGTSFEQRFWFRLIDVNSGKGLVWMHQIPEAFDYSLDKPFFHIFSGKSRMFGFRFDEDAEAAKLFKKVKANLNPKPLTTRKKRFDFSSKRLAPTMISAPAPGTFVHVAHVGFNAKGQIETSDEVEPGWTMMLQELQGHGVTESMVRTDRDFVDGFMAGVRSSTPTKEKNIHAERENVPLVPAVPEVKNKRKSIQRKPVMGFAI